MRLPARRRSLGLRLQVRDLWGRAQAYKRLFDRPEGQLVLRDLARFCCADETTHVVGDADSSKIQEGRRQVWMRINQHLRLTPAQIDSFTIEVEE